MYLDFFHLIFVVVVYLILVEHSLCVRLWAQHEIKTNIVPALEVVVVEAGSNERK